MNDRLRTDDQLRAVAWHEAGHGLTGLLVGRPLELVSIRPGERFVGVTLYAPRPIAADETLGFGPAFTQPPALRDRVERSIITSLAGPLAETLSMTSGYGGEAPCEDYPVRAAAALERQSPRVRELLERAEGDKAPRGHDDEEAWALAEAFDGPGMTAAHHLAWLAEQARELRDAHAPALAAIGAELFDAVVLTGDDVLAIASRCRCGCHRWAM